VFWSWPWWRAWPGLRATNYQLLCRERWATRPATLARGVFNFIAHQARLFTGGYLLDWQAKVRSC
jgi:hypothetical protein